tara:strand:- start:1305 stop:2144 length:840 start_codon:yes stop_codon:yes gene_type:complete
MIDNLPVKKLVYNNLTIEGYSRAAVQTYWRIPELKIGFDLGAQPWSFMGTGTWFVSHGHLDHIAALPIYVARRRMMKMEPPTIYLPEVTIDSVKQILYHFTQLDRGKLPCRLLPIAAGNEIELSREYVVTVTPTKHSVPSFGFIVWERRKKLKAEYQSLSGAEIRDLRLLGKEVSEEHRRPLIAYLGDSAPEGLDAAPEMYEAEILITEMTFLSPHHRRQKIRKFGHLHLEDVIERRDRFNNKLIIASHFSTRYHKNTIRNLVEKKIPDMIDGKLHLWI